MPENGYVDSMLKCAISSLKEETDLMKLVDDSLQKTLINFPDGSDEQSKKDRQVLKKKMIRFLEAQQKQDVNKSHIRVMYKADLDSWLIPTLRVVPRIVEAIENGQPKQ